VRLVANTVSGLKTSEQSSGSKKTRFGQALSKYGGPEMQGDDFWVHFNHWCYCTSTGIIWRTVCL